ncbi:MAG: hypothetical protein IT437_01000 [Phycisphaerales bacterium]|nr:hypothetical protein [Phycisphaerales bacterium]
MHHGSMLVASEDAGPGGLPVAPANGPAPEPGPDAVVVDSKVGDVNGRPIFASEVLDQGLADRLTRMARTPRITLDEWTKAARTLIRGSVDRIVNDELIEAEARASLQPQFKVGLKHYLDEKREEARREASGSRVLLERKLRTEGKSVEDWVRDREREALIQHQINEQVFKRAIVTWQDIRFYYEVNQKEFNPDPTATFRLVRVLTRNEEAVRAVQSALDRGEPFERVAAMDANTSNRADAGRDVRPLSGDYAQARLFAQAEMNDAAHGLAPGQWTQTPIRVGDFTVWMKLESIDVVHELLSDPKVQRKILVIVGQRKRDEVLERYLEGLKSRAHVSGFDDMTGRLLEIAGDRYWKTR